MRDMHTRGILTYAYLYVCICICIYLFIFVFVCILTYVNYTFCDGHILKFLLMLLILDILSDQS